MREPTRIIPHPDGCQTILFVFPRLELSAVTVAPEAEHCESKVHGLGHYCTPGTFEVALFPLREGTFADCIGEPLGYRTIEELGQLVELVETSGSLGWPGLPSNTIEELGYARTS